MKTTATFLAVFAWLATGNAGGSQLKTEHEVPGWLGRAYDLFLPSSYGESISASSYIDSEIVRRVS